MVEQLEPTQSGRRPARVRVDHQVHARKRGAHAGEHVGHRRVVRRIRVVGGVLRDETGLDHAGVVEENRVPTLGAHLGDLIDQDRDPSGALRRVLDVDVVPAVLRLGHGGAARAMPQEILRDDLVPTGVAAGRTRRWTVQPARLEVVVRLDRRIDALDRLHLRWAHAEDVEIRHRGDVLDGLWRGRERPLEHRPYRRACRGGRVAVAHRRRRRGRIRHVGRDGEGRQVESAGELLAGGGVTNLDLAACADVGREVADQVETQRAPTAGGGLGGIAE